MGLWDKLRQASSYLRELRLSLAPDSYYQYKRRRQNERDQSDRAREHRKDSAERGRETEEREREYEGRYTREREGDIAREPPERAEGMEPDR